MLSFFLVYISRRILHSKGELSEDRHKQYEEFAMSYQKLLANSQSLADLLDENMPDLPQDKPVPEGMEFPSSEGKLFSSDGNTKAY